MKKSVISQKCWGAKTLRYGSRLCVAAFLAAFALPASLLAVETVWNNPAYKWQPSGDGPHYWNDPANWEKANEEDATGHQPTSFQAALFDAGGTVRIPAATAASPFVEGSLFVPRVQNFPRGDKLVVDGSGTYWLKQANPNDTIQTANYLNLVDFNGYFWGSEGGHDPNNVAAATEFLATNVVIEIERAGADGEDGATLTLKQGFLNFYDPLGPGQAHGHNFQFFHSSRANLNVVYEEGTHTRTQGANVRANGPNQLFWVKGGLHEFFGNYSGKSFSNANPSLTRISSGVFDVQGGWLMPEQADAPADLSYEVVGRILVEGTGTLIHTNNNTTYVGYGARWARGYLDLEDDALFRLHNLQMGARGGDWGGTWGAINMSGRSRLEMASGKTAYIGKERDSFAYFNMSDDSSATLDEVRLGAEDNNSNRPRVYGEINLRDNARLTVQRGLYAGRSQYSTGIVDVAGNALLTTRGTTINLADGSPNAYARLSVSGNGGLEHGAIYVGANPGNDADLVFSGNATNHVWNDNNGYTLFVGKTSNTVGRAYFKDNSTTTWGQVRIAADDNNRTHDTAKGEMYIMDNASVTVNYHLYLGRSWNTDALLDISGGTLTFGPNSILVCGDASNAYSRVSMTGGKIVANNAMWFGNASYSTNTLAMTGGEIESRSSIDFNRAANSLGDYYIGGDARLDHTYGDRIFISRGSNTETELVIGDNAVVTGAKIWFADTGTAGARPTVTVKDNAYLQWRGEHMALATQSTNILHVTDNATLDLAGGINMGWRNDPTTYVEVLFDGDMKLKGTGSIAVGGGNNACVSRFYLRGGSSLERCGNIDINGQDSRIEVSGGNFTFNHLYLYQGTGYETATNTLRVTGGRIRFDDWTVVGNNNQMGRIEVAGGEFSTREINLGFANQSAALTSVMEVTGGRVTLENNGADCYFQLGNGNTCFGHLRMTGGEIFAMCLRGNHNGSGSATAFFDGGRIAANKVHNNWALVHNLDTAAVGATGLTVDANGFNAWLNQEFTDADDGNGGTVDGVVRITGSGSVDIRKNSNHAKTVIDGGRMSFSNGATVFGRTVQLVNGGVYSLEGAATSFAFDHLVIGDATSAGVIKLDQGDTITITGADGLEVNNLVLDVSHITANGSYPVFTTSGDGTIDPAKLGNVTLRSADPFKTYTLNANGAVTVADRVFAETAWTGAASSAWGEGGNWSANVPDVGSKAVFGSVNNKMVQVSSGAAADVLEFTAPGYVVYGSDAVSVGVAIDNTASGQVSIASPITLGEGISFMGSAGAETMLAGSLSGTGVAATKSGSSKVTVSGNNTGLEAAWTINGGTLAFAREEAFGTSVDTMELDSGTLAYTGENAATLPGKLVVSGPSGYGMVVDTAGDLTVTNAEVTGGRLVKKGVGTLTLDLPAGRYNLVDVNDARFDNPGTNITFPVSGDTPESTTMFNPLTVVEGKMVIEGNGSNETRVVHQNGLAVGDSYAAAQANSELELRGVYFDNYVDAYVSVGHRQLSSVYNEPWIRVLDGSHLQAHKIVLGWGAQVPTECGLAVTNASVYCTDHFLLSEGWNSYGVLRVGPHGLVQAWNRIEIRQKFDILIEGEGAELKSTNLNGRDDRYTWDGMLQFSQNQARGTLAVKNGGTLTVAAHIHAANLSTDGTANLPGVQLVFNGGTLNLLSGGTSMMAKPQYQGVWTEGDGMTFSVAAGAVSTWTIPIRGDGGLVKTGAGELVFAGVRDMTSWPNKTVDGVNYFDYQYDETDMPNGWYEGATEVREGILTLTAGSITNTTDVTVGEAGALNLGGNAFAFPSVAGSGVVSNGTLNAVIKVAMDASSHTGEVPSFSDVVLPADQMFDLDFGDGAMELRVPYTLSRMGVPAASMSRWGAVSGGERLRAKFSVDSEGRTVVTLHSPPGTLIIVR